MSRTFCEFFCYASVQTLEIIYRVEVSRSTWAEQQSPRNVLAELQLTAAKTKVTTSVCGTCWLSFALHHEGYHLLAFL